jgi:hypothetical protein
MVSVSFHFTKWSPLFLKFWLFFMSGNTHGARALQNEGPLGIKGKKTECPFANKKSY